MILLCCLGESNGHSSERFSSHTWRHLGQAGSLKPQAATLRSVTLPNITGNFQTAITSWPLNNRCTAIELDTMGASDSKPVSAHVWKAYVVPEPSMELLASLID